jgi:hypothetical protein
MWFWWRNLRERDHLEDPGIDGEDNTKMDFQETGCWWGGGAWIELIWLRTGTDGRHL